MFSFKYWGTLSSHSSPVILPFFLENTNTTGAIGIVKLSLLFGTLTLRKTNIAMENPPFWWYLPGKIGIFMGYVSFREGKMTYFWKFRISDWKRCNLGSSRSTQDAIVANEGLGRDSLPSKIPCEVVLRFMKHLEVHHVFAKLSTFQNPYDIPIYHAGSLIGIPSNVLFLRKLQQTPGTYPRPSTTCFWRTSLHICIFWVPGVCSMGLLDFS